MVMAHPVDAIFRLRESHRIREAPAELAIVHTRDELRDVLFGELLEGDARWLDAAGLRFGDRPAQKRLLRAVRPFRQGQGGFRGRPHTAVLDWSTLQSVGIEGLAGAPALARTLTENGAALISCAPRNRDVAMLLEQSGLPVLLATRWVGESTGATDALHLPVRERGRSLHWRTPSLERPPISYRLSAATGGAGTSDGKWRVPQLQLIAPILEIAQPSAPSLTDLRVFYDMVGDAVESGIRARDAAVNMAELVVGFLREGVTNSCEHAGATCIGIAAGIERGPRPTLELGIADNGIGIGARLQLISAELLRGVPERYFVQELFREDASRRGRARLQGRGFIRAIRWLLNTCDARVRIRSGGVLLELNKVGMVPTIIAEASAGFGTIIQASVPLDRYPW